MIDWHNPPRPNRAALSRELINAGEHNELARLHLYRRMGYSWARLKELGILTDELLGQVT